jgi:hypothetical protein
VTSSSHVYSLDKLIGEARRLASDYRRTTGKPLAGVSAEIAEYDAARLLNLELTKPGTESGYDAVGCGLHAGKRYLIKGRTIFDDAKKGQRIGQIKVEQPWDGVVLVLMDENHESYEIYVANRAALTPELELAGESRRAKRGPLSVAKFKIISRLIWTREEGLVDNEIWVNPAESEADR